MRYWYFGATLPGFLFGAAPPFGEGEFLSRCGRSLEPEDFAEIESCLARIRAPEEPGPFRSSFLDRYAAWERSFRRQLAGLRAQAAGRAAAPDPKPVSGTDQTAAVCFSAADPYQAELAFERERWQAAERFSAFSSFDLDFVAAYRVKLDVALRLSGLERTRGEAGYRRLYDEILGGAPAAAATLSSGAEA